MPPRRFSTLVFFVGLCFTALIVFSKTSQQPTALAINNALAPSKFTGKIPTFDVPDLPFSFQKSSHKPPEQKNSTSGSSSWYSDWKWLNPFSSSVTLDEDRAVLPPLPTRPPVYTYYDEKAVKDEATMEVDQQLLRTWRRAWWAQGFRPVILSRTEAMANPLAQTLQGKGMSAALEFEFFRWLAWGQMGSGLLSSWHCLPMGAHDDLLLSYLRRGQYEHLVKFDEIGGGLFAGEKSHINEAIKEALSSLKLNTFKTIVDAIPSERFRIEHPSAIAHYDSSTITSKYPILAQAIVDNPVKGRLALNTLMQVHLQTIWQNTFSSGIAVLKPLPAHTTALIDPSLHLARLLAECPESILQSSCPPNRPRCAPCVASKISITTPPTFRNTSSLFTISTVPHPYTMIALNNQSDAITVSHIRRYTDRDPWITAVTRNILGDGRGGPSRLMALKDAIASPFGMSRSLWFTVEQFPASISQRPDEKPKSPTNDPHPTPPKVAPLPEQWLESLDWHFGFPVPRTTLSHGESLPPVPGPERWPKPKGIPEGRKKSGSVPPASDQQQAVEIDLLVKAREVINARDLLGSPRLDIRDASEKWNLADTEAWKFARAFRAREEIERRKWEEVEAGFGGSPSGKARWWQRSVS